MPLLRRRNFLPTVIISILLWASLGIIVFFLNPDKYPNIILFFFTFTLALTLTLALLVGNTKKGFLLALVISLFLLSRLI